MAGSFAPKATIFYILVNIILVMLISAFGQDLIFVGSPSSNIIDYNSTADLDSLNYKSSIGLVDNFKVGIDNLPEPFLIFYIFFQFVFPVVIGFAWVRGL